MNFLYSADIEAIRDSVTNFTASAYKSSSSGSIKLSRVIAETSIESEIGVVRNVSNYCILLLPIWFIEFLAIFIGKFH